MRYSLKIRDAKKMLPEVLEDNPPMHFGNASEYLDHVLSLLTHFTHGPVSKDRSLRVYYEFKTRFKDQIVNHYTYGV